MRGRSGYVNVVKISLDGKYLLFTSRDRITWILDVESGAEVLVKQGNASVVNSVTFSPDGKCVATVNKDKKTIRILEVESGVEVFIRPGRSSKANPVAFSPDGQLIIGGDIRSKQRMHKHLAPFKSSSSLISSPIYQPQPYIEDSMICLGPANPLMPRIQIKLPAVYSAVSEAFSSFGHGTFVAIGNNTGRVFLMDTSPVVQSQFTPSS